MKPAACLSPIRRLPQSLANQIAAGEVIERPASVVKELMENSLDAGAGEIRVELDQGGMARVEVSDDGHGIPAAQLPLAVAAHATSKLDDAETLMRIATLGFRGEALASICAVSRWCLTSCESGGDRAAQLCHDQAEVQPAAHPPGTRMQVKDLFYNLPARRKFLRTEQTEYRHVETVFRRLALSHFEVGFSLAHNGRVAQHLARAGDAAGQARRLRKVCGKAFADQAFWLDLNWQGMRLRGWLGQREYSRPHGDIQYFYINGRIIRDRIINHAIRQAYQNHLYPGRFPAFVLYLDLPFDEVDVNVHPTKHEVRFRQARQVHDFLSRALREALYPDPHAELLSQLPTYADRYHRPAGAERPGVAEPEPVPVAVAAVDKDPPAVAPRARAFDQVLAVLFGRYALLKHQDSYWLGDLREAQARLMQRALARALEQGPLKAIPLLIPATLVLNEDQMAMLERQAPRLARYGLDYSASGPTAIMIRTIPAILSERLELASLLPAILAVLDEADEGHLDERIIDTLSEHGSRWVHQLGPEQIDQLLNDSREQGLATELFLRELNEADLQRLFARAGD